MSQPTVKWGQAERYFNRHGYKIISRGGDKRVIAPRDGTKRGRTSIRVGGHTSCGKSGSQILPCYLSQFKNVFGVSIQDMLGE